MYRVTVKNQYVGGGVTLSVGLSVQVPHDSLSSPLTTTAGKQAIAKAFMMQCGLDLSNVSSAISAAYMTAEKIG